MVLQELSLEQAKEFRNRFYKGMHKAYEATADSSLFPIDPFGILYITADDFIKFWLNIHSKVKLLTDKSKIIFPKSNSLRLEFGYLIQETKITNLPIHKRVSLISLFKFLLENSVRKDVFCEKGNFVEEFQEQNEIYLKDKKLHGRLFSALANFVWALFGDCYPEFSHTIHGPYNISNDSFIVREYTNLSPKEIWPELTKRFPMIRIVSKYSNDSIEIDGFYHIHSKKSLFESLTGFQVFMDNKLATEEQIESLIQEVADEAAKQHKRFDALPLSEKKKKMAVIRRKLFKEFADSISAYEEVTEETKDKLESLPFKMLTRALVYEGTFKECNYSESFMFSKNDIREF